MISITQKNLVKLILLVICFSTCLSIGFSIWSNKTASLPDTSAASAAEYLGINEERLVHFDYPFADSVYDAYAVETQAGIQVVLPDFDHAKQWKMEWLGKTSLGDVVLEAIAQEKKQAITKQ